MTLRARVARWRRMRPPDPSRLLAMLPSGSVTRAPKARAMALWKARQLFERAG